MIEALISLIGPIWPYILAFLIAIVGYFTGRVQGKAKAEVKHAEKEAETTRQTFDIVNEVSRETSSMDADAVNRDLSDNWLRGNEAPKSRSPILRRIPPSKVQER